MNTQTIINQLKEKARGSWEGEVGEDRAVKLESFLNKMLTEYSEKLGYSKYEIISATEKTRNYSAINYYQEANFPSLEGVDVYETLEDLKAAIKTVAFKCPACNGISTNPYECNSGVKSKEGEVCDWKSYGLFRTLGEGYRFTIKESFLEKPRIDEIFMPIDLIK
ncbi:hypothetical protein H0A36_25840 [Endozoicomonas sp. SM1973]|uniref:Uncharacterized protein n=1 Tax=Spartinivicinus marinus TaxID=2994442 RepID=A0A853IC64_9GAMM|nr:hypothetical protein [Spartinivicinus marinus]MCX4027897.1 hypothetical protein [Spartinivicinus marinus]NYZ69442.1 hypothetical protein [Spartinivicinus marinus]